MDQKLAAFVETLAPKLTQLLAMPLSFMANSRSTCLCPASTSSARARHILCRTTLCERASSRLGAETTKLYQAIHSSESPRFNRPRSA